MTKHPLPCSLRASDTTNWSGGHVDTGGSWQDAGSCAPGWGGWCHVGTGQTGSSCWEVCLQSEVGGWGDHVGKQTASHVRPPRIRLCGAFLLSLRGFFFSLPCEIGKRWSYSCLLKAEHKSLFRLQTSNTTWLSGAGHYPAGWGVCRHF